MNVSTLARNAYSDGAKLTATPRSIEYQVLSRLTGALVAAEKNRDKDYPAYIKALSRNLEFWTIVGADVARDTNPLPQTLKAQIFFLYEFVNLHTRKLTGSEPNVSIAALIEINENVINGLNSDSFRGD